MHRHAAYAGDRGWTAEELDHYIEMDLERRLDLTLDFEIADAVMKVKKIRQKIHSAFAPPLSSRSRNTSPMIENRTIR